MRLTLARLLIGLAALIAPAATVAMTTAGGQPSAIGTYAGSESAPPVPRGTFIVADDSGQVIVLDERGRVVRKIPGSFGKTQQVQALQLAPDRRHAYVAVYARSGSVTLYVLDLVTGRTHKLAPGLSPALNPPRTKLAYISLADHSDLTYERALVIRDLRRPRTTRIPFASNVVPGTPPELVVNWSPDGRRIAVFDGHLIRLVDVGRATSIDSQPTLPGKPSGLLAPVYLDSRTMVTLANCCIGRQHLVAIDLRSGARRPFATLSSPPENIWRLRSDTLLVQDALTELALVTRGHVDVIATKIVAAAPA